MGHLPLEDLPVVEAGEGFTLLSGIRVLDLTTSVAGPYASMLLSDFGAEVVKVEKPGGDDARGWGPPFLDGESLWFTAVNRNKKSVVLDLLEEGDREILRNLGSRADVVITNQPAAVQRKLGLDHGSFSRLRPDIIFTSITGFGLTGDRSDLTCYDLIAEGYSGIMDITGDAAGQPQKVGAPAADMLAGQDAAMATMAALFDRMRTGRGHLIDVSLVESMTRFLCCRVSSYLGSGEVPVRSGGTDSVIAIYQQFATRDLPLTLGLGTDGIWRRFWKVVGDPAFGDLPEFRTNANRRARRSEIVGRIQEILLTSSRAEWLSAFAEARIPAGPINTVEELVADEALRDRGLIFALHDGERVVPQLGLGIRIDDRTATPRSAPPRLGEHSREYAAISVASLSA